ncbi:MAG TPA: DUF3455 domain-containing protein [Pyrinomonadaceae bacterium]|jgi:hypothetical protein|nr:DUF3455 domain-containing protein [Pyrinomonadaceae bacterium]
MNYKLKNLITRRLLMVAWTTALVVGFMVSLPQLAHAQDTISPPIVPDGLNVEDGNEVFLLGRGVGTQNYVCAPCDPTKANCPLGVAFTLFTPQATLFNDQGEQLITHFSSPNPVEGGTVRVTWQDSRDTSSVWAKLVKAVMVRDDSIAWVLLNVKDTGTQAGPTGDRMTKTTFIQRVNTVGGLAPAVGCLSTADLGHQAFIPYRADYFFYKKSKGDN